MVKQKTLMILRHGKAETGAPAQSDESRALNAIGRDAARRMGEYMRAAGLNPELALISSARRTRETWELAKEAFVAPPEFRFSDKLYLASANEVLREIAAEAQDQESILMVGHNPGLHELALHLVHEGDAALLDALHMKLPTCGLAVIDFAESVSWGDVGCAGGVLRLFTTPRLLAAA